MKQRVLSLLIALSAAFIGVIALPGAAKAQAFGENPPPAQPALFFGQENAHLQDILALQRQLVVLDQLIKQQKFVLSLTESAVAIRNLDPKVPKPDKALCAAVPANFPCAQAYGDLYDGYMAAMLPAIAVPVEPVVDTPLAPQFKEPVAQPEPPPIYADLFWTDITCLGTRCSAVITTNPSDDMARYRVTVGEKLPDGGTVAAISVDGVSLSRDGKTVSIQPAPADSAS